MLRIDCITSRRKIPSWAVTAVRVALCGTIGVAAANAEPGFTNDYLPMLWGIVAFGGVAVGIAPFLFRKFVNPRLPMWATAIISIAFVLAWLGVAGPVIIIGGSFILVGRTM
ncbi:MAG: hypothetical protein KJ060_17535 [Candidatus Hydrogenedentes bacterium]|nr:hypothetical protein [Candidatus Hydrogenedentota bacterium]